MLNDKTYFSIFRKYFKSFTNMLKYKIDTEKTGQI